MSISVIENQGIRNHAESLCTAQLGFRTELDALEAERREVDAQRLTSLDRNIAKHAFGLDGDGTVDLESLPAPWTEGQRARQLFLAARLRTLTVLELAAEVEPNRWQVNPAFLSKLRALQIKQDRQKMLALGAGFGVGQPGATQRTIRLRDRAEHNPAGRDRR